jgi:hypothetical protein
MTFRRRWPPLVLLYMYSAVGVPIQMHLYEVYYLVADFNSRRYRPAVVLSTKRDTIHWPKPHLYPHIHYFHSTHRRYRSVCLLLGVSGPPVPSRILWKSLLGDRSCDLDRHGNVSCPAPFDQSFLHASVFGRLHSVQPIRMVSCNVLRAGTGTFSLQFRHRCEGV